MDEKVIMVGHEAVGGHLEMKQLNRFLKNGEKQFIVLAGGKYLLPAPTTIHYMIPGTGIFYA